MLIKQKYRLLFSPKRVRRPGPQGPTKELIDAVVEMKRRNHTWGCKRIAQQMALAFAIEIDKEVVRRITVLISWISRTRRLACHGWNRYSGS